MSNAFCPRMGGSLVGVALCLQTGFAATPPLLQQSNVFVSGQDGYAAYRIPAIETAPDGSLLAFAEARKYNLADPGVGRQEIDLVLKRSTNVGVSWSAMRVVEDPGECWSAANPATLLDRQSGLVWVFYLRGRPSGILTPPGRAPMTSAPSPAIAPIMA